MKTSLFGFITIALILFIALFLRLIWLQKPDLTADEMHYVTEGIRLFQHDPFISIRHHPFQHPAPSIGHPFLFQVISAGLFSFIPPSSFSVRLPSVLAGIATVLVLLLFNGSFASATKMAAFFFAILPFAVRFNRDAHLDSLFTLWITFTALALWRYKNSINRNFVWLIAAGISTGLALSTKLDGFVAVLLGVSLLVLIYGKSFNKKWKQFGRDILCILFPAAVVFLIFNDPSAYLNGVLHPSDTLFKFNTVAYWFNVAQLPIFFAKAFFFLLSPLFLLCSILAFFLFVIKREFPHLFLLTWLLITLGLFIFHLPANEYGVLPAIPPLALGVSLFLSQLKLRPFTYFLFCINIFIFTFLFGLYIYPLPYKQMGYSYNRTVTDTFYQDTIAKINSEAPVHAKVFIQNPQNFPTFNLRSDISWSYYGNENEFDLLVLPEFRKMARVSQIFYLEDQVIRLQDGGPLIAYLYKNSNRQTDTSKESKAPPPHHPL